jgi:hypothetical protein
VNRAKERQDLDRLIEMRDSDNPATRAEFDRMLTAKPAIRIALGYYEIERERSEQA